VLSPPRRSSLLIPVLQSPLRPLRPPNLRREFRDSKAESLIEKFWTDAGIYPLPAGFAEICETSLFLRFFPPFRVHNFTFAESERNRTSLKLVLLSKTLAVNRPRERTGCSSLSFSLLDPKIKFNIDPRGPFFGSSRSYPSCSRQSADSISSPCRLVNYIRHAI